MTKVEELRARVRRYKVNDFIEHDQSNGYATADICVIATDSLDSLIEAVAEAAFARGKR